ncbi:hypothetical protein [Sphingobium sp. B2D3C]|nr:hypothetical protein [Sphingobium sp. B2D3C]MCW2380479.1 hypothetical protein [Sphingobium sp. B2D3B]
MKQSADAKLVAEAVAHSVGNRREVEASKYAGCFSCCATFDVSEVREWLDEWTVPEKQNRVRRWTARCPRCSAPTIIGSSSGLLDDQGYLPILHHVIKHQPTVQ